MPEFRQVSLSRNSIQGNHQSDFRQSSVFVQKFSSGESLKLHRWASVSHECVQQYSAGHMGVRYIDKSTLFENDEAILENIDISKDILENIDIDKDRV